MYICTNSLLAKLACGTPALEPVPARKFCTNVLGTAAAQAHGHPAPPENQACTGVIRVTPNRAIPMDANLVRAAESSAELRHLRCKRTAGAAARRPAGARRIPFLFFHH